MSMQSLLSGNMTWLTIQSCWFSHSPKKSWRANFFPGDLVLELEPYHKTDTTGTTDARGVWRRYARAFDGVVPQLTNQPWKKANVWIALTFQEAGKRRVVAGSVRRGMPWRRRRPTARRIGCYVVVAGAGEFCLCFVEVDRVQTTKTTTAIKLAEKKMFHFITILYCRLLFAMSFGGRACCVFCYESKSSDFL